MFRKVLGDPVDSAEACKEAEIYLNTEFTRIRENYPDLITKSSWPSSKGFSLISRKAPGLFIFAEVVVRFVEDSNPIRPLREVLTTIFKVSTTKSKEKLTCRFGGHVRWNCFESFLSIYWSPQEGLLATLPCRMTKVSKGSHRLPCVWYAMFLDIP